ncbi:hypothetical protein [Stenotrophomonas rhizophila]|uniref:hypothetical protein n=1 Tax=Stenotrophomonas rhizophila TaxID=216778 RepID=UPI001E5F3555|nr:hypothetical protein [Stenotrophomonas rhizophila]MCC7634543.1 hypothetical protein [Stenotrophomonas rhizophila]MCC7664188.1 hypothetical protein [Stenotrophomonas rhizophila]
MSPMVSTMKQHLLLCAVMVLVVACAGEPSAGDAYLSPQQEAAVLAAAKTGDLPSIKRLIAHFEANGDVRNAAGPWRERARKAGDPAELYHHAALQFVASQEEPEPALRRQMLEDALTSARDASAVDPTAQSLTDQIELALRNAPLPAPEPEPEPKKTPEKKPKQ